MGIPLYFKTISDKFSHIILSQLESQNKKFLFLDLNCAIHPCCRNFLKTVDTYQRKNEADYERKMIQSVLRYIEKLVTFVDSDYIFISIDGVAPKAKMNQQRVRRFKTVKEKMEVDRIKSDLNIQVNNSWDTNAISPGTKFMENLSNNIKNEIAKNKFYRSKHIVFSNANVPGEGEHKILKYVKETNLDGDIIIYGLDADLIMLSMVSQKNNCYLLREAVEFGITDYDKLLYLSIDELKESVICDFKEKFLSLDPLFSTNINRLVFENGFINDYLFVCFLLGNDFMPHLPALSLRNNGLDKLINCYLTTINTMGRPLINKKKIDNEVLLLLFRNLSVLEDEMAAQYYKKRKNFKLYKPYDNELDRRMDYLNNLPSLDPETKEIERKINMGEKYWRDRYYYHTMDLNSKEDRDRMCADYIKTLQWTYLYYFSECPTYHWSYNYNYGPSLLDIYNYIKGTKNFNINTIKFSKKYIPSPLVQLLSILPAKSQQLLPDEVHHLFNPGSLLSMYYPKEYKLEMLFKKYYWMCDPKLPVIDLDIVKSVVDDISISSKYKKRFTKQRNFIKEKMN